MKIRREKVISWSLSNMIDCHYIISIVDGELTTEFYLNGDLIDATIEHEKITINGITYYALIGKRALIRKPVYIKLMKSLFTMSQLQDKKGIT